MSTKIFSLVEELIKEKKLAEAINELEKILSANPDSEFAAEKLLRLYQKTEQVLGAAELLCKRARQASAKGERNRAYVLYKQALSIRGDTSEILESLVEEAEQLGKRAEAISYSLQLLHFFQKRKMYFGVFTSCTRLVRFQPEKHEYQVLWINALIEVFEEKHLIKVLSGICNPSGLPFEEVASDEEFCDPGIHPDVMRKLQEIVDWIPSSPTLFYFLGWVAYKKKSFLEAIKNLRIAFKIDPAYCMTSLLYVRILWRAGMKEQANFVWGFARNSIANDDKVPVETLVRHVNDIRDTYGFGTEGTKTMSVMGLQLVEKTKHTEDEPTFKAKIKVREEAPKHEGEPTLRKKGSFKKLFYKSALKESFGEKGSVKETKILAFPQSYELPSEDEVSQLIKKLDQEFGIGIEDSYKIDDNLVSFIERARPKLEQALAKLGDKIRIDLSTAFFEMGLYEEAERQLLSVAERGGEFQQVAYFLAARAMIARKDYYGAINILSKIEKNIDGEKEGDLAVYYTLGEAYESLNLEDRSQEYYQKVASQDINYLNIKAKVKGWR